MVVYSTGTSGTIGKNLPDAVIPLAVRLGKNFALGPEREFLLESSVIHLAGVVGPSVVDNNSDSKKVNVDYTLEFAKQAMEAGISKFVYVSSSHVYGSSKLAANEMSDVKPISGYGEQKLLAEKGLKEIFSVSPEKLVIARVFSLLDLGMTSFSLGGLAEKIIGSSNIIEVRNANDVRDFMDLKSCSNAIYQLAKHETKNQIYNICSGTRHSVREAITLIVEANGGSTSHVKFIAENSNRPYQWGSNERFKKEFPGVHLGWKYAPN